MQLAGQEVEMKAGADDRETIVRALAGSFGRQGWLITDPDLLETAGTDYRGWFHGRAIALARS